ncbi:MAG: hypothetical protein KIS82_01265 [Ferruginibacter sp.]|nr:hypothetical protein [Ferruginibacter sp.]
MKETRASILLFLSLILFIFSLVILSFWGYQKFFLDSGNAQNKGKGVIEMQPVQIIDSAAIARRDSLEALYNTAISRLGSKLDSSIMFADSLRIPMNAQLEEYAKLKREVSDLLKEKNGNNDLELAKQKIAELQSKVRDLLGKYDMVEAENKRLVAIIEQLKPENKPPVHQPETAPAIIPTSFDTNNTEPVKAPKPPKFGFFAAYDLRLSAWTVTDNKEIETYKAFQADKFIGSFIVNNPNPPVSNNIEMLIVFTAPDGHVIQKSEWESGTFETVNGTKKVYSLKLNFDYTKGEPKKLLFTLAASDFKPGTYTMQVFQNGAQLGKTTRILN